MNVYALHVGCNDVDDSQYPSPPLPLSTWHLPSSFAATDLIAGLTRDFFPLCAQAILRDPTVKMVGAELDAMAASAAAGDLVLFTYAGHGAQIPTSFNATNPGEAGMEPNLRFEVAILLRDRMMIANEMGRYLQKFDGGVHFVAILDGCGIASFHLETENLATSLERSTSASLEAGADVPTTVAVDAFEELYRRHKAEYDAVLSDPGAIAVNGLIMSSTVDGGTGYQKSNGSGSLFTTAFCAALREQAPPATYDELRTNVEAKLLVETTAANDRSTMHPQLVPFGSANDADKNRKPLT